jgi:hypothetical protein
MMDPRRETPRLTTTSSTRVSSTASSLSLLELIHLQAMKRTTPEENTARVPYFEEYLRLESDFLSSLKTPEDF